MKKKVVYFIGTIALVFILFFIWKYLLVGETFKTFYDQVLPPGLPEDIPLVEGKITSSVKSVNIYGDESYGVEIETTQPIAEVITYYKSEFTKAGNPQAALSYSGDVYGGDGRFRKNGLALHIYPKRTDRTKTEVIIGVEMDAYK